VKTWFEGYQDAISAITRKKQIGKWRRNWKIRRIEPIRRGSIFMKA
jgi:putative endonuclease